MFKKTIKFKDFNEVEREEDFYFHLSKAEIAALAHGSDALQARMRRIEAAKDGIAILTEMRAIIRLCCGTRSDDGSRFLKTPEAQSELLDSPAFDELLLELMDAKKMVEFFQQLLPKELQNDLFQQVLKAQGKDPFKNPPNPDRPGEVVATDDRPAYQKENRRARPHEMRAMTREEMVAAFEWEEKNGLRGKQAE